MEWIERELQEAELFNKREERVVAVQGRKLSHTATHPTGKMKIEASGLVKNLDAKIEMLRAREELVVDANSEIEARSSAKEMAEVDVRMMAAAAAAEIAAAKKEEDMRRAQEWATVADKEMKARTERERIVSDVGIMTVSTSATKKEDKARREKDQVEAETMEMAAVLAVEKEDVRVEIGMARQRRELEAVQQRGNNNDNVGATDVVARARQQPKSTEEERKLQEKYASIEDLEERAFNILVDLGMVES
jgi:hypothetical protein